MSKECSVHPDGQPGGWAFLSSDSSRFLIASIALTFGTILAYFSGMALLSHLTSSLGLAFQMMVAILGFHIIAYGLLKTGLDAKDKMVLQVMGMVFVTSAGSSCLSHYYDSKIVFVGTIFLVSLAAALAGWRYRWLHPR